MIKIFEPKHVDVIIRDPGDPSVGIWGQEWVIEDVIMDEECLPREVLRKATKQFFESYIADEKVNICFSDELEKWERQEREIFEQRDK